MGKFRDDEAISKNLLNEYQKADYDWLPHNSRTIRTDKSVIYCFQVIVQVKFRDFLEIHTSILSGVTDF